MIENIIGREAGVFDPIRVAIHFSLMQSCVPYFRSSGRVQVRLGGHGEALQAPSTFYQFPTP